MIPAGWKIEKRRQGPITTTYVIAPNGYIAELTPFGRNPENVFLMLVDALMADANQAPEVPQGHLLKYKWVNSRDWSDQRVIPAKFVRWLPGPSDPHYALLISHICPLYGHEQLASVTQNMVEGLPI